jgi:hypothetical protein
MTCIKPSTAEDADGGREAARGLEYPRDAPLLLLVCHVLLLYRLPHYLRDIPSTASLRAFLRKSFLGVDMSGSRGY